MVVYKRSSACVLCAAVLSTVIPSHLCNARLWHKHTSSNVFGDFSKNSENAAGQSNTDVVVSKSSESSINSNVDSEEKIDILTDYEKNNSKLEQSDIKNSQEQLKETIFVDKDQFGKGNKSNSTIRSLAINAAEVGAGALTGILAMKKIDSDRNAENIEKLKNEMKNDSDKKIKALETQMKNDSKTIKDLEGKIDNCNTKMHNNSITIGDLNNTIMNYEKELDEKKKELEDLQMQPGHRAFLWGGLSYLFEYLCWFGENQKGTKIMAMQGRDSRIALSVFWFLFDIIVIYITWVEADCFFKSLKNKAIGGIITATSLICPPVGGAMLGGVVCLRKQILDNLG